MKKLILTLAALIAVPLFAQTTPANPVVGDTVVLTATVQSGTAPFGYEWYKNGTVISGEKAFKLTLANVQLLDAANYKVKVSNTKGSTVSPETPLTVDQIIPAGAGITVTVTKKPTP